MGKIAVRSDVASRTKMVSYEAVVHRACRQCHAPGVYQHDEARYRAWPGVLVAWDDDRCGKPVGGICPNCRADRPAPEDHGVIAYHHRNPFKRWWVNFVLIPLNRRRLHGKG